MTHSGATIGPYEILRELDAGGMGAVLLARRRGAQGFEKLVAIKRLRSELRALQAVREMFLDEARLLARLEHPAVAQVHDVGEDEGELYLVMDYVAGVSFRDLIAKRPPPAVAARAMAEAARGLHAAHELVDLSGTPLGVVHRDVSPENLMLGFDGRVRVLDFGIALVRDRRAPATEHGAIKGKPPYLAPEQIKNQAVDRRTDVFAACVVLHELLTGEPVYTGSSIYAIARAIEHHEIAPPSVKAGSLLPGLDRAVMTGLGRTPGDRYGTALALAEALEAVADAADGESLEAYARRALAAESKAHMAELRRLQGGSDAATPIGRATGAVTALALAVPPPGEACDDGAAAAAAVDAGASAADALVSPAAGTAHADAAASASSPAARAADAEAVAARSGPRGSRRLAMLAAALLLLSLGGGWLLHQLVPRGGHAASEVIDAATAMAATATTATAMTATRAPADAGVASTSNPPAGMTTTARPDAAVTRPSTPGKPPDDQPGSRSPRSSRPGSRHGRAAAPAAAAGTMTMPATPEPATAEPRVEQPAQAAGTGYVTVAADPFALVRIDGKEIGTTPIFRHPLPAGRHEIVLASPDSGDVRLRRTIVLGPDQTESVIAR